MYTSTVPEQLPGSSVVRDNFVMFNSLASVLIDIGGASHSFISSTFASTLGLEINQLESFV